ncbi:hypothetical protein BT69DRAFT_1301103 [Atractiella rhizophila]|nr:hypothetical protein BT69DRAFT_1301103 [Atractiella rhizophila]
MTSSQYARDCTTGEPQDPGGGRASPDSTATNSRRFSHPFLKVEDLERNTLCCLGRDGQSTSRDEFLSYHSLNNQPKPPESLWYPLSRFELTTLFTKFQDSDLHVISSFRVICKETSEEIAARGEISDFFKPDPVLLSRLSDVRNFWNVINASTSIATDDCPPSPMLQDGTIIAANPTLSLEVRSSFAVTGTVISSISCFFFASGVLVEILKTKVRRLILGVAPQVVDSLVADRRRSNFFGSFITIKRYFSLFVAFAALAASISAHPDIPLNTKKGFAVAGIVLAATGWALCVIGMATSILVQIDSITEGGARGESSESAEE